MEKQYYDGTKLLSLLDLKKEKPEVYLCVGNRSSGKTTFFNRWFVKRFLQYGEKFCLIYRYSYELDECAEKFFKDVQNLFFPSCAMTYRKRGKGVYAELYINEISCGYAVTLNSADQIKKLSHFFSDVTRMLMDEFQSETNHYCSGEIEKFISIHRSIARGNGKQSRYLPVYMLSNSITLLNPYYNALGISGVLKSDTKFLRGNGYVLEQNYNESASVAQTSSKFMQAFSHSKYVEYAAQNVYLHDNLTFIDQPSGRSRYIASIRYNGHLYSIKEYSEIGVIYCDDKADGSFPIKISVTTEDHQVNYVMLKQFSNLVSTLQYFFDRGAFRFKNPLCKEAIMKTISYY